MARVHLGCGASFGVWDASPDFAVAYAVTARGAAQPAGKLSTTMTTDPDGKPYAHNEEQAEAAKLAAISKAAIREAVPEAFWEEERIGLIDQLKSAVFKAQCLREENVKLRAELQTECEANEVGRVVDAMTPEQVEAYLVKMGMDMDEVRARGARLRAKIETQMTNERPGFCPASMADALRDGHRMYAALECCERWFASDAKTYSDAPESLRRVLEHRQRVVREALSSPNNQGQPRP